MQKEQIAWSEKNFGKQHERYPLMGMIEELLEFDEAWKLKEESNVRKTTPADPLLTSQALDTEITEAANVRLYTEVFDAVGDIGIYMLDYLGKRGKSLNDFWKERVFIDERTRRNWYDMAPLARRLAHHQLKMEQGIRGTPAEHLQKIDDTCRAILAHLDMICRYHQKDFLDIIDGIWSKVRQRDWTKNPTNAHAVAEVSS